MPFKGKIIYKKAFLYLANLNDTESALLSHEMRESVCVFILIENMVELCGYCIIFCCYSVARSVGIAFFSIVLYKA